MNKPLITRLQMLVAFELDSLEKRLDQARSFHYPSAVAVKFIDSLIEELKQQRLQIKQAISDFLPEYPQRVTNELRSQHRLLINKLTCLDSLKNAQTQNVPWSLVPSIERIASELSQGSQLLTTCTYALNYSIRWYPTPKSPIHQFSILQLPIIHKHNAFLHLLIGHELFHPLLQQFFVTQTPSVVARLKAAISHLNQPPAKNRLDKLVEFVRYAWQRAIEELMCDMGCAILFGPAAVFASIAFQMGSNLDEAPSSDGSFYPPPRYRIREVMHRVFGESVIGEAEQFHAGLEGTATTPIQKLAALLKEDERTSWAADILSEHRETILREIRKNDDLVPINQNPLLKTAYEEVQAVLPDAWNYIRQIATSAGMVWLSTIDEVPFLLRSLELLVPPGEIRDTKAPGQTKSPSLPSIAIATWLYQLKCEASVDASLEQAMKSYSRCCRLMLKGFEDVELRREYDAGKDAFQQMEQLP
ncbi:MAG: hypothetical protein ABFC77_07780 [Thermoguttaceae bacterium]